MSEYIKREDAIRAFKKWLAASEAAEDIIADLPTIDIVRCKDCEYFKLHESVFGKGWICKRNHIVVGSVDFCSYGERKDNEYILK